MPYVVEISDDDTDDITSHTRMASEEIADNQDDWEDSDDESLLDEIVDTDYGALSHHATDIDTCTPEEALAYRNKLRDVGPNEFVLQTVTSKKITAKRLLSAFGVPIPAFLQGRPDTGYYRLLGKVIARVSARRRKLYQYNTIEDATNLFRNARNVMFITGAGISTNLGIPDFRSKTTGFYDQMKAKGFEDPQDIFSLDVFLDDPAIFYENAGETLAQTTATSPTHAFVRLLQDQGKLLTVYTQNIDNIEGNVGIEREKLVQCHGSWATATCLECGFKVSGSELLEDVKMKRVPKCKLCIDRIRREGSLKRKRTPNEWTKARKRGSFDDDDSSDDGRYDIPQPGVMKPDITFFGEKLPERFFDRITKHDRDIVDLVVIIGTSMQVAPVSEIPMMLPSRVPHIYISHDPITHFELDITLLGDCDIIVGELAKRLGWELKHPMLPPKQEVEILPLDMRMGMWRVKPVLLASELTAVLRRPPSDEPVMVL